MSYIFFEFSNMLNLGKPLCNIRIFSEENLNSILSDEFTRNGSSNDKWLVFSEDGALIENSIERHDHDEQVSSKILQKWISKIILKITKMDRASTESSLLVVDDFVIGRGVSIDFQDDFAHGFVYKMAESKYRRCEPWECFKISCILNGIDHETSENGAKAIRDCFQNDWSEPLQKLVGSRSIYQMIYLAIEDQKYANEFWQHLVISSGNTRLRGSLSFRARVCQSAIVKHILCDAYIKLNDLGFYVDISDKCFVDNEELIFETMSLHVGNEALDVVWTKKALEIGANSINRTCCNGDYEKLKFDLRVEEESDFLSEYFFSNLLSKEKINS